MPQDRLPFTMQATTGRGPAPPDPHGNGPLPHGWTRIPVTVEVTLPPEATGPDGVDDGASRPGTMPPASMAAQAGPGTDVRRLGPATGWPVLRGRWGDRPLPPEAKLRILNALFEGPGGTRTPGFGPGIGEPAAGLRPGELPAALRAMPRVVPSGAAAGPVMPAEPDGPDPGFEAFQAMADGPGTAGRSPSGSSGPAGGVSLPEKRPITGLPASVMRGPGPGKSAPPPGVADGGGWAAGRTSW